MVLATIMSWYTSLIVHDAVINDVIQDHAEVFDKVYKVDDAQEWAKKQIPFVGLLALGVSIAYLVVLARRKK